MLGDYKRTLAEATEAAEISAAIGDEICRADAENLTGTVFLERAEYHAAARSFGLALARFQRQGDAEGEARARSNLGLVAWRLGDLPRARADFLAALAVFEAQGDARARGNLLNSLGLVAEDEGDRVGAIALYGQALDLMETTGDVAFTANIRANLADAWEGLGNLDEAWLEAERALDLRLHGGIARGVVGSRVSLGRLALQRGNLARAQTEVQAGLESARALGLKKHQADLVDLSARLAAERGAWAEAYTLTRQGAGLRESLRSDDLARRITDLRTRLDVQEAERLAAARQVENEALRGSMAAAESASRAKSAFVAVMSHEIRAPLTAALGAMELLRETTLSEAQDGLARTAESSARMLLALVDDVLDIAAIEAGHLRLEHQPLELDLLLAQLLPLVQLRARAKGIALVVRRAEGLPATGLGDLGRLRQILLNLLLNAVKFTDEGRVTLGIEPSTAGLVFTVSDTGVGIDPEALPRLFEPFTQADPSITRRFGGTGLGLSIARKLTDAMGGSIRVESTPGAGATFTIGVPFPPAPQPRRGGEPSLAAATLQGPVLVVDDDPVVAGVLVAMLRHLGCAVDHAPDAATALKCTAATRYALVLLDVRMPEVDGCELATRLRSIHGPGLRLQGLSGAATHEDRERALASGMDGYMTKPVTLDRLRELLQSVSAGARSIPP